MEDQRGAHTDWCGACDLSRVAVATLDEARAAASSAVYRSEGEAEDARPWQGFYAVASDLPAEGGTVGPLPDGTTITVAPVRPGQLAVDIGWTDLALPEDRDLVAAWNAQHGGAA